MRTLFTLVLATIALCSFSQTTITATQSGSWNTNSTWDLNRKPQDGDIVVIPSGITVLLGTTPYSKNPESTRPLLRINISGTLDFSGSGNDKLYLDNGSVIQIYSGGQIITDDPNTEVIAIYNGTIDNAVWNGTPATLSGPRFASAATASTFSFGVLPIKLRSFTAQSQGNRIALNWATDEELNSSYFVIERSTNARNWSAIQNVAAKGEAAGYTTTDATPAAGENFYRLKSVDIDGKFEYSHVLKVVRGRSLAVHVSPNPATEQVTVSLATPSTAPLQLQLVNNNGQVVSEKLYASGTSLIQFDLKSAAPGVYTLLLRNGNTLMETTQLLIK